MATGASCSASLNQVDAVTKADVKRVANKIFVDSNRTSARIEYVAPNLQSPARSLRRPHRQAVP